MFFFNKRSRIVFELLAKIVIYAVVYISIAKTYYYLPCPKYFSVFDERFFAQHANR